jgi:hypothetical protein
VKEIKADDLKKGMWAVVERRLILRSAHPEIPCEPGCSACARLVRTIELNRFGEVVSCERGFDDDVLVEFTEGLLDTPFKGKG